MTDTPEGANGADGLPSPSRRQLPWRTIALTVGGGVAIAATASAATLAATHNSAVAENAQAYINGLTDGLSLNVRSYLHASPMA